MGSTRDLIERNLESWNAHDRTRWAAAFAPGATLTGPGGLSGTGPEMAGLFYDIWQGGFPQCEITASTIAEDGQIGVLEAVFHGTHSGPLGAPSGTIEATGHQVSIPFVIVHQLSDDTFTAFRLYFDQLVMLAQLGVMPADGASS